jgi:hypothetical protein
LLAKHLQFVYEYSDKHKLFETQSIDSAQLDKNGFFLIGIQPPHPNSARRPRAVE